MNERHDEVETTLAQADAARFAEEGYWTGVVVTDQLDRCAERDPDGIAVVDSRRELSWFELQALTDKAASALTALGVTRGDVVSIQLPNWIEFIVAHLATARIGAISNPLVPTYRQNELAFMLGLARSKVVITTTSFRGHEYPSMYRDMRESLPALQHVIVVDATVSEPDTSELSWNDFLSRGTSCHPDLPALRPDPNDVALIIYTSGTTGEPKGVMHTHNTLHASIQGLPERLELDSASVLHTASTLGHLTGLSYCVRLALQLGAKSVYQDVWDPQQFANLVEQHRISFTAGATPFLHDTVEAANGRKSKFVSLTRFCCMGAPIPRPLLRQAREVLPQMVTVGGWGQSENSMVTVSSVDTPEEKIVDRDGFPLPGMKIRVVDENETTMPVGIEGRLQVAGPFLFVGYLDRIAETRRQYRGEWFDTGDIATVDEDGYLSITGRTKDIIVRGGENLPVAYIENVLHEDPRIHTAALVGVPDARLGERACAVVVPNDNASELTLTEMKKFLRERGVARNYWPESIALTPALPRTASGKIQKFQLRNLVVDGKLKLSTDAIGKSEERHG